MSTVCTHGSSVDAKLGDAGGAAHGVAGGGECICMCGAHGRVTQSRLNGIVVCKELENRY